MSTFPLLCSILALIAPCFVEAGPKYPVVIVPGYMGSQLEGRLNKSSSKFWWCQQNAEQRTLWFDPLQMLPYAFDCWEENFRLYYDNATRRSYGTKGVEVGPKNFGDASILRYISPYRFPLMKAFDNFVSELELRGYRENVNIKGAPFDWRKAPYESETWMVRFKYLLERSHSENNRSSIVVCHSYGCPFVHHFLRTQVDQKWKDDHVRTLVGIAGAWAGHYKSLHRFIGTDQGDLLSMLQQRIRSVQRTFTSNAFLLPRPEVWKDHVLVSTTRRNYTANDYEDLFRDMGELELLEQYRDSKAAWGAFEHPGTELHCISGIGHLTAERVNLVNPGFAADSSSVISYGAGDGRLHGKSMESCKLFEAQRPDKRFSYEELNHSHLGLIQEKSALDRIIQIIENIE